MTYNVEIAEQQWRERWGDAPVGDVGSRLLFENERVRVWDLTLAPGETSPLHTHMNPYLFVVVESSPVVTRFADGREISDDDADGAAVWVDHRDETRTHTLSNIGDRPYINRVVEILVGPG